MLEQVDVASIGFCRGRTKRCPKRPASHQWRFASPADPTKSSASSSPSTKRWSATTQPPRETGGMVVAHRDALSQLGEGQHPKMPKRRFARRNRTPENLLGTFPVAYLVADVLLVPGKPRSCCWGRLPQYILKKQLTGKELQGSPLGLPQARRTPAGERKARPHTRRSRPFPPSTLATFQWNTLWWRSKRVATAVCIGKTVCPLVLVPLLRSIQQPSQVPRCCTFPSWGDDAQRPRTRWWPKWPSARMQTRTFHPAVWEPKFGDLKQPKWCKLKWIYNWPIWWFYQPSLKTSNKNWSIARACEGLLWLDGFQYRDEVALNPWSCM